MNSQIIIRKALGLLVQGIPGTVTAGCANAWADSALDIATNYFSGGGISEVETDGGSGSSMGGLFKITDYSASRFTVTPALTTNPNLGYAFQVGDPYTAWSQYTMDEMIMAINFAIADTGEIGDTIEIASVAAQQAYLLYGTDPKSSYRTAKNVARVTIATSLTDTTEMQFSRYWEEKDGYLIFKSGDQPSTSGLTIKVYYNRLHDEITYNFMPGQILDDVSDHIDEMRLVWLTAFYAARSRHMRVAIDDPRLTEFINQAGQFNQRYAIERQNYRYKRQARLAWL